MHGCGGDGGVRSSFGNDFDSVSGSAPRTPSKEILTAALRRHIEARQSRGAIIDERILANAPWGVLLDLLLSKLEERPVTVSDACIASGSPATTALRSIGQLEQEGAIVRRDDPKDRRRIYLELTDETFTALLTWAVQHLLDEGGMADSPASSPR